MPIVVGIDGTGPMSNDRYAADFANSFVRRICTRGNAANKRYSRGPITPGGGLPQSINRSYSFITARRGGAGRNEPILLTGFSRGGLGVLVVADMLRRDGISVTAMLLFDAVDRHLGYSAARVPDNVLNVFHARRSRAAGSRESFGNCGTQWNRQTTNYVEQFFRCTHGAVGGTPQSNPARPNDFVSEVPDGRTNVTFADNVRISAQVWAAVQPFINRYNFI